MPPPIDHTGGAQPPIACTRGALLHVANPSGILPPRDCTGGTLPCEIPHMHGERDSSGGLTPPLVFLGSGGFSCRPDLLMGSLSWDVLFTSPWAPLPSPSACLHTANPSPLPRTDLQNLSLSTQPPPEHLGLWFLGRWCNVLCSSHNALPSSVQLLCFSPRL